MVLKMNMEEILIAPCGMNCALCYSYLAMKNDLKKKGVNQSYCAGCRPRGKNCAFMKKNCEKLGNGLVKYCFECADFPCRRLKHLDERYRTNYRMSMVENLEYIKKHGMKLFLEKEQQKWQCPECGRMICCHNGLCYHCKPDESKKVRKQWWMNS
jgi:hypothetical protein